MAISVGTGNYPPEILGETDLFGKGWLDIRGTFRRAHRFIKMLSTAVRREGRREGGRRERKGRKEGGKEGGRELLLFLCLYFLLLITQPALFSTLFISLLNQRTLLKYLQKLVKLST